MAKPRGKRKQLAVAHGAALDWVARNPSSEAALRNLDYVNSRIRKTGGRLTGKEETWSDQHGKYRPEIPLTSRQRAALAKGKGPIRLPRPRYTAPKLPEDPSFLGGIKHAIGDVPEIAGGIAQIGKGIAEDVRKGRGLPGAAAWAVTHAPGPLGFLPDTPGPFDYKKLDKHKYDPKTGKFFNEQESFLNTFGRSAIKDIPEQAALLADPMAWYQDPLIQLSTAAGLVLPFLRVGSVGRLATGFKAANPGMTMAQATKAAVVESYRPGMMAAHGVEGGIPDRVIKGKYATAPGRMTSRNPLGRGAVKVVDTVSERLDERSPGMRGSSSSRAAARNRKVQQQAESRRKAFNLAHEETVAHAIAPSRRDAARRAAGLATKIDPQTASALIASLEGPVGATVREAVELKVKAMQSVLDQNVPLREISDGIEDLKKQRQEAIDADPDFDPGTINTTIAEQQAVLDFKLGKSVPPVTGSPIRDSVLTNMRQTIGKQRANEAIKVWDAVARGDNPRNPGQWYLENIAQVRRMPVEQFAPEGAALYQRMASGGMGWYFPSQRMLTEMVEAGDRPRQAGQLFGELKKNGISTEEIRNAGLEVGPDPMEMIRPSQILDALNEEGYFETFDPDVELRKYEPGRDNYARDQTRYHVDALNSRDIDEATEYYEMTVRYPELPGTRTGESHWGETGNVYHVRFQVFLDEDGNRVMLVDEIQSDWASDYRKAKKEDAHERPPAETAAERAALEERATTAGEEAVAAERTLDEYRAERQRMRDEGIEGDAEPEGFNDELLDAVRRQGDARYEWDLAQEELRSFEIWSEKRVPMSPMGPNKYAQNAIRQVLRRADSDDVDYVVLVDGDTQALRNQAVKLGADEGVDVTQGRSQTFGQHYIQYGEWVDEVTGEALTNEQITAHLRAMGESGSFTRLYNEEFPSIFKKVAGAEGRYLDDAYEGRHSAQRDVYDYSDYDGYVQPEQSGMPGTVFEMTDEVKAKIRQDQPLYRRNFEGVPQGATEFLADGRARVTMFQKADVSTWIHELAHVAVRDLDPDDLRILEREIAGGRSYGDWTEADQEGLARSFETYMRDGHAAPALREVFSKISKWMRDLWRKTSVEAEQISPETADVFDRMLGRRNHQNTVVLDDAEIAQVRAVMKDLNAALDSGDLTHLDDAAAAFAKLSDDAEAAGVQILMRGARSEEHAAAILEGLRERKNIVTEDYRRRGLIDHAEDARGYFPQMSMWEALGQPQVEASRLAAMGNVIGTPRVTSKALNKNRNKLVRYQTGEVLNDPTAVMYILRARLRVLETIRARDELYAVGDEVKGGGALPDPDKFTFIRNPDVTPSKIKASTEAAVTLARGDYTKIQARRIADDTDEINGVQHIADEIIWDGTGDRPSWVTDEPNVRYVPTRVAEKRLGTVFASGPSKGPLAVAGALAGMLNAGARAALIYAPLFGARYATRNWIQNAVLMALTQPSAFAKLMSNHKLRRNHPQLWDRINEEFGTIQAQALPEFNVRAQGKLQRTERDVNRVSGQVGEYLGRYADVPLRAASWRRHAEGYGFSTPEQYTELLDNPDLLNIRNQISQRTREDMIDFDALSPWEKEVLSRYLFIWPFIRGSAKWPFMFAREYPGRFAVAAMGSKAAFSEDDRGPEEMLRIGGYDMSWLDPTSPAREKVQALHETLVRAQRGQLTLKPLLTEALAPQYQEVVEMMAGGRGGGWGDLGTRLGGTFIPFLSTEEAVRTGKLEEFAQKTFGKQTRPASVTKKADKWMGELDTVLKGVKETGYQMPPELLARVEKMRAAYGDWTEASSRAKWANMTEGLDSVDATERTGLALEVMHEHYRVKYDELNRQAQAAGWESVEEVVSSGKVDNEKVYREIYDQMFGLKEQLMREAKKAGWSE